MRGLEGAARYGLSGLSTPNKELVRLHNLILVRVAEVLAIVTAQGRPWIFETPTLKDGEVSVLRLDEFQRLLDSAGVEHTIGVQCTFGALSSKPTSWVSYGVDLHDMPKECRIVSVLGLTTGLAWRFRPVIANRRLRHL